VAAILTKRAEQESQLLHPSLLLALQKLEQQWKGAKGGMQQQKESMSGAMKGASEGAQAGYQAGMLLVCAFRGCYVAWRRLFVLFVHGAVKGRRL
jgi:hypothetical protein